MGDASGVAPAVEAMELEDPQGINAPGTQDSQWR